MKADNVDKKEIEKLTKGTMKSSSLVPTFLTENKDLKDCKFNSFNNFNRKYHFHYNL